MAPRVDPATQWERRVVSLLEDMGLENPDGARGQAFALGGHQIDAIACFANVMMVFECKLGQELKTRSVRKQIQEMRGIRAQIKKGAKEDPIYGKYEHMFHILLAKNYQFTEADKDYAKNGGTPVLLKADEFFDYYLESTHL